MKQAIIPVFTLLALMSCGQRTNVPAAKPKEGSTGLFPVVVGGRHGFIDKTGKCVIEPQFEWASSFLEGLAAVAEEGKVGYINRVFASLCG